MSIPFWLSLFFSTPPSGACVAQGTPLFEMRERSETSSASTTTRIFSSGAWTVRSGRTTDSGCFDRQELRAIRRAIQQASWQTSQSQIACFAYDPNYTEYRVRGSLRFTERMCSGTIADTRTLEAIAFVKQELADERTPVASCRPTGTPLFEIRTRSDDDEPTSTVALYGNGAWTYQPIDADGRVGVQTAGCLETRASESLRALVDDAPWQTTTAAYTCRAYSPTFTEYRIHGRLTYTARLCGAQKLDAKSLGAIEVLERELRQARDH